MLEEMFSVPICGLRPVTARYLWWAARNCKAELDISYMMCDHQKLIVIWVKHIFRKICQGPFEGNGDLK